MVSFAPVPTKPDDLSSQSKIKGRMKITLEDGTEEIYSMPDVTDVRQLAQRHGTISSTDSRLNVDPDLMARGLAPPSGQQVVSRSVATPPSPLASTAVQQAGVSQQIQAQQSPVVGTSDPSPQPSTATAQPAAATATFAQPSPAVGLNYPAVMYQHIPSSTYGQHSSLSGFHGGLQGASTSSLPCYYPSTLGMPSQANIPAAFR